MDFKNFYLATDIDYSLDLFRTYISFIEKNWLNITGRPTGKYFYYHIVSYFSS